MYRWQEYYKDPITGERKRKSSKWFSSKAECEESRQDFIGDPRKASRIRTSFSQVFAEWLKFTSKGNTPKTVKDKANGIQMYFSDLLSLSVFDITPTAIKDCMESEDFQKLSTSRKNKMHGYLKSIFSYAEDFHDLPRNPMKTIPTFKATESEKLQEVQILSPADFSRLVDAVPMEKSEYSNLFIFLYWTGMRLNEAASLTFADVKGSKVYVSRQWRDGSWVPLKTKGSVRTVTIDASLVKLVSDQKDMYRDLPGFGDDWFIFGGARHLAYTTIERIKNEACDSAELPRVKIHSFRHSHASNLIAAGVPLLNISKRLGHSSVSMTSDIYGHLVDRSEDDVMAALEKIREKSHIINT